MGQGTEARPLGGKGDESNRSNPNSGATRRAVNEVHPAAGCGNIQASLPDQGHNNVHSPENSNPKEGLVKGDYSHLLHEPKISSTRHELPKDIAAFDHHFADGKKKKADKKS